jgi:hypothetical protein
MLIGNQKIFTYTYCCILTFTNFCRKKKRGHYLEKLLAKYIKEYSHRYGYGTGWKQEAKLGPKCKKSLISKRDSTQAIYQEKVKWQLK